MNDVKDFTTVRIFFSKSGRARYISHLDLNRTMTRAVRRAGLPIWYTEGFSRHPYLTFAAPLSLGFEGERETMDLRLAGEMTLDELVSRLDATMPEGLHILSAALPVKKAGEVTSAVYRLSLGCPPATVEALLAQPSVTAVKRTKKKELVPVELKPILEAANNRLTETEDGTAWELTLPCGSELSVNPSLVIAALREAVGENVPCAVCRLRVLDRDGNEFA